MLSKIIVGLGIFGILFIGVKIAIFSLILPGVHDLQSPLLSVKWWGLSQILEAFLIILGHCIVSVSLGIAMESK